MRCHLRRPDNGQKKEACAPIAQTSKSIHCSKALPVVLLGHLFADQSDLVDTEEELCLGVVKRNVVASGQAVLLDGVFQVLAEEIDQLFINGRHGRVGLDEDTVGLFYRGGREALADATDEDVVVGLGLDGKRGTEGGVDGPLCEGLELVQAALDRGYGTGHGALAEAEKAVSSCVGVVYARVLDTKKKNGHDGQFY